METHRSLYDFSISIDQSSVNLRSSCALCSVLNILLPLVFISCTLLHLVSRYRGLHMEIVEHVDVFGTSSNKLGLFPFFKQQYVGSVHTKTIVSC